MLTSSEANELRAYVSRYPIDDESNLQLPFAMLRADVKNMLRKEDFVSPLDLMPFRPKDLADGDSGGKFLRSNWDRW
jgi:hypothetical protein